MSGSHVPKFGNWDEKDIQYTTYFENARRERVRSFNPNDPDDNPEAFMPKYSVQNAQSDKKQSKSPSHKTNIDPPRITDRRNSNKAPLFSKSQATVASHSPIDSNDEGSVHQKHAYSWQTEATGFSDIGAGSKIPKNRKAMRINSSKKWCCLLTKTRD